MADAELRARMPERKTVVDETNAGRPHPAGSKKHGGAIQILRMLAFVTYFGSCAVAIHVGQILASPLYFFNRDYFYAFMALTKQSFGLAINFTTQWFSPTVIRISAEAAVANELTLTPDGRLEGRFPARLVMMANHQIYTDWLYLWWISYVSRMHGHIYIILKESLKYIPIIGPGMMFYGFIFMARNWVKDQPRLRHRLQKLNSRHGGPMSGNQALDPMWLLIFPEGTNLSPNGRKASAKWAAKAGLDDMQHQLLPRSTGLQFCLQELRNTVEWVYDCTIAYEGIPRGEYGQDVFPLWGTYFEGRPPKSVNMYWRRFEMSKIPLDDSKEFELWLRERWIEKDNLLEEYTQSGRFPPNGSDVQQNGNGNGHAFGGKKDYLETEVRARYRFEFLMVFAPLAACFLSYKLFFATWSLVKI